MIIKTGDVQKIARVLSFVEIFVLIPKEYDFLLIKF